MGEDLVELFQGEWTCPFFHKATAQPGIVFLPSGGMGMPFEHSFQMIFLIHIHTGFRPP